MLITVDTTRAEQEAERIREEINAAVELLESSFPFARVTIEIDEAALIEHLRGMIRARRA